MRRLILLLTAALSLGTVLLAAGGTTRHPMAVKADQSFFTAFNSNPKDRGAPLRDLWMAALADPSDGRTWLLLGLNHLWMAAEEDRTNPLNVEHLVLAERFLSRAQTLRPGDHRIPSWLIPVRLSLARIDRNKEQAEAAKSELLAAYAEDPIFHSFSVASMDFDNPPSSPDFQRGLAAMQSAHDNCKAGSAHPACFNTPHWPHSREAFSTFEADYELKAGHPDRAREILLSIQKIDSYPQWPFRGEAEDRLQHLDTYAALYADGDRGNDPPSLMSLSKGLMCQTCHLGP